VFGERVPAIGGFGTNPLHYIDVNKSLKLVGTFKHAVGMGLSIIEIFGF